MEWARPAASDRARAAPGGGRRVAVRAARRRRIRAVQPCPLRPRPRRPLLGREDRRRVRLRVAPRHGRRRGMLLPGFDADLVVLDRDPFGVEPEELPSIRVVATMLAGRWVHNPPPWD